MFSRWRCRGLSYIWLVGLQHLNITMGMMLKQSSLLKPHHFLIYIWYTVRDKSWPICSMKSAKTYPCHCKYVTHAIINSLTNTFSNRPNSLFLFNNFLFRCKISLFQFSNRNIDIHTTSLIPCRATASFILRYSWLLLDTPLRKCVWGNVQLMGDTQRFPAVWISR